MWDNPFVDPRGSCDYLFPSVGEEAGDGDSLNFAITLDGSPFIPPLKLEGFMNYTILVKGITHTIMWR